MIPHYSPPNTSSDWRRVIVIRYLAADCRLGREAYQDFRTGAGFPRECTHTTEATCHHNPPAGLLAHQCSPSKKKTARRLPGRGRGHEGLRLSAVAVRAGRGLPWGHQGGEHGAARGNAGGRGGGAGAGQPAAVTALCEGGPGTHAMHWPRSYHVSEAACAKELKGVTQESVSQLCT